MSSTTTPAARPLPDSETSFEIFEEYRDHLRGLGFTEGSVTGHGRFVRHFMAWLDANGIGLDSIDGDVVRWFFRHDCECDLPFAKTTTVTRADSNYSVGPVTRFVRFLEGTGRTFSLTELEQNLGLLDQFLQLSREDGYSYRALNRFRATSRHFLVWLHHFRVPLGKVDNPTLEGFFQHDCCCGLPGIYTGWRKKRRVVYQPSDLTRFMKFLTRRGEISDIFASPAAPDDGLEEFRAWLRQYRNIGDKTIRDYTRIIASLLPDVVENPDGCDVTRIREALMEKLESASIRRAKRVTSSLRMYLRFLASTGRCPGTLVDAVPTVPEWRQATLPRYLAPEQIERAIASCDPTTTVGVRDRAIVLLLARLGLRAGEVSGLRLGDIDWENALIRICGKSRREAAIPLPQDVGDALLDYIVNVRPRIDEEEVFLTVLAPHRPFKESGGVSYVARVALERAGVDRPRFRGAHVFRHSAATNLLRAGASLRLVGSLLRHESLKTTELYAKVDANMLQELAQPWIRGDAQ